MISGWVSTLLRLSQVCACVLCPGNSDGDDNWWDLPWTNKTENNENVNEKPTHKSQMRAKRTRMRRLQHQMPLSLCSPAQPLRSRRPPRHEHDPARARAGDGVNHLLRKLLPPFARVAVCLVRAHRQRRVEQQHAAVGPGREQAATAHRRLEVRIVGPEGGVDVLERGRCGRGRAHGKGEAVGLVDVVVGVLPEDDAFHRGQRSVAGPAGMICFSLSEGLVRDAYCIRVHNSMKCELWWWMV